eukprot:4938721-Karenia_brevis.AAC.1
MQSMPSPGDDKLDFTLMDDDGVWIQCCAMGATMDTDIIVDDSSFMKVEEVTILPCKQKQIEIGGHD